MKKSLLVPLCLFSALALAGSGCGPLETAVESGNREQVFHVSIGADPEELDPHILTSVAGADVARELLEGLVTQDPAGPEPRPGVAERWEVSDDGLVYTFYLRDNARWSNGDPVTANDFLFSYRRMLSPGLGSQYAYMLFVVENAEAFNSGEIDDFSQVGFEVVDDHTFRVRLSHPTPYFLSLIIHSSWLPVHEETILAHGEIDRRATGWTRAGNFVGNGAFRLTEWRTGRWLTAVPNEHYWDADSVRLNEIRFHPIESPDTEERAFRSGQVHAIKNVPPARIDTYARERPEVLRSEPYLGVYYFRVNADAEVFQDARVRRALSLAIDRERLIRNVMHDSVEPAYFFTPPETGEYTARTQVESNPDKARELLAEAGYPDGEGFPQIEFLYNTQEVHRRIAEAAQQMWRQHLNIHVNLRNQEWQVYLSSVRGMNYDVARAAWIADYPDANSFLDMWVTGGGNNNTGWSNEEYDELIARAGATQDPEERLEIFQEAEAILMEEMPVIPIYHYRSNYLLQTSVRGWEPNLLNRHPLKYVWLEE